MTSNVMTLLTNVCVMRGNFYNSQCSVKIYFHTGFKGVILWH